MKTVTFIILLFITLTCSVCETFEVRSSLSVYQVFKNEDITLEWTFTDSSLDSLIIYCFAIIDHEHSALLIKYVKGLELPQHSPFRGRVQLDKDLLPERRIRLHVSSLRTEDSGDYYCEVVTREGSGSASCRVTVTAGLQTTPETKTETEPEPEDRKPESGVWIGLILGLSALVCVCGVIFLLSYKKRLTCYNSADAEGNIADRVPCKSVHLDIGVNQPDGTALKTDDGNLSISESSSSDHLPGHHVTSEHECQTLKLTD